MRTQSPSSPFMPIVVRIEEPFQDFEDSMDEPFDLDRECRAYVQDVAQFTLQRLKQHLDEHGDGEGDDEGARFTRDDSNNDGNKEMDAA